MCTLRDNLPVLRMMLDTIPDDEWTITFHVERDDPRRMDAVGHLLVLAGMRPREVAAVGFLPTYHDVVNRALAPFGINAWHRREIVKANDGLPPWDALPHLRTPKARVCKLLDQWMFAVGATPGTVRP